jgi:diguanylate cyclase (GGDEF)-like protein
MILLDLDRFKEINDEHCHAAGDAVLSAIGQTLAVNARRSDIVGRWGGEEFVLLLPETGLDEAVELAERLREQLRARVIRHEGAELRMTASFGVAALDGQRDLALLIDDADKALYAAKMAGRDRVNRVP